MIRSSLSRGRTAAISALIFAGIVLPMHVSAQLPDFKAAGKSIQEAVIPIVGVAQWILVALALFMGLWTAFKAAKGDARSWLPAILLLIVAGVAWMPGTFLLAIGMENLADAVGELGFAR